MLVILFTFLFVGMAMLLHGMYEEKLYALRKHTQVKYKFIPRTYYDEQLFQSSFASKFDPIFERPITRPDSILDYPTGESTDPAMSLDPRISLDTRFEEAFT